MNNQSNRPMMMEDPDRPPPQGAFPVWIKVYTKPGERTFSEIIDHPDATAKNAYIWVFIVGMLSGLINSLTQFVIGMAGLRQTLPGYEQMPDFTRVLGATGLVGAICGAPIAGVFSVIGFAISTAIIHWTARFFGSQEGSFDKLAYALAAAIVPFSLVTALLAPFSAIRYAVFCTLPIILLGSVYLLYLELAAIKAVYRTGWLEAAGAFFLPTILIVFLCACAVMGLIRLAGPSINEIFQQVQQNL
jgi:hypothetical protein